MSALTPERLAELRRLAETAAPGPWYGVDELSLLIENERATEDIPYIAAVNPATVLALLDAADLLTTVRDQITHGALCPMCSTGVVRWTVGLVCQLCGTDYSRPGYATLRRDSTDTSRRVLADALAVRAERDALAAKLDAVRALHQACTCEVCRQDPSCEACDSMSYPCATLRALDGEADR